jgi:hypothetical protein
MKFEFIYRALTFYGKFSQTFRLLPNHSYSITKILKYSNGFPLLVGNLPTLALEDFIMNNAYTHNPFTGGRNKQTRTIIQYYYTPLVNLSDTILHVNICIMGIGELAYVQRTPHGRRGDMASQRNTFADDVPRPFPNSSYRRVPPLHIHYITLMLFVNTSFQEHDEE